MKSDHIRFCVLLTALVVLLSFLTVGIKSILPQIVSPVWYLIMVFFIVSNCLVYFITVKKRSQCEPSEFVSFHTATTVIKLVIYLAIILTYTIIFKESAKPFIITFLFYYLCFTVFETYVLVKKIINNE